MKTLTIFIIFLSSCYGCSTVQGIGKDMYAASKYLEKRLQSGDNDVKNRDIERDGQI